MLICKRSIKPYNYRGLFLFRKILLDLEVILPNICDKPMMRLIQVISATNIKP